MILSHVEYCNGGYNFRYFTICNGFCWCGSFSRTFECPKLKFWVSETSYLPGFIVFYHKNSFFLLWNSCIEWSITAVYWLCPSLCLLLLIPHKCGMRNDLSVNFVAYIFPVCAPWTFLGSDIELLYNSISSCIVPYSLNASYDSTGCRGGIFFPFRFKFSLMSLLLWRKEIVWKDHISAK